MLTESEEDIIYAVGAAQSVVALTMIGFVLFSFLKFASLRTKYVWASKHNHCDRLIIQPSLLRSSELVFNLLIAEFISNAVFLLPAEEEPGGNLCRAQGALVEFFSAATVSKTDPTVHSDLPSHSNFRVRLIKLISVDRASRLRGRSRLH